MADDVVVKYDVDLSGLKKAETELLKVNEMVIGIQAETKEAFSGKAIDEATGKLEKFNNEAAGTVEVFQSAKSELNALTKQITSGQLEGKALETAKKRAADLTDKISDTRQELQRMASDTKVFDTMVEGVRGVTAAFSVAQGVTALFGEENEDLQKTLLKVQGATALLTGVQELANIATKEGGIVTQALTFAQSAYNTVVGVSTGALKAFKIALATTGIGALIVGLGYLASAFFTAGEEAEDAAEKAKKAADDLAKANERILNRARGVTLLDQQKEDFEQFKKIEQDRVTLQEKNNLQSLIDQQKYLQERLKAFKEEEGIAKVAGIGNTQARNFLRVELEKVETAITKTIEEANKKRREAYETDLNNRLENVDKKVKAEEDGYNDMIAAITKGEAEMEKEINKKLKEGIDVKPVPIPITFSVDSLDKKDVIRKKLEDAIETIASELQDLQPLVSELFNFGNMLLEGQIQDISASREKEMAELDKDIAKQLAAAGDNEAMKTAIKEQEAKKREDIEKRAAKKEAEIRRAQAVLDKSLALFNVAVQTATNINKQVGGLPATAPLLALAIATGIAQAAAIAARPIPPIPEFEEGGLVPLMGGNIKNGQIKGRRHAEGGVLIRAEGGEFINNRQSTKRYEDVLAAANDMKLEDFILHKYVAPALRAANARQADSFGYDDGSLKKTVRESEMASAKYIVKQLKPSLGYGFSGDGKWRA